MQQFMENNLPVTVLAPDADRYNAGPATDIINMALYDQVVFILSEGAGGTGTVKIVPEACSDNAGTGNTAFAAKYRLASTPGTWGALTALAATGYTTVAGANKDVAVVIRAADLPAGLPWVRLQLTEVVDSPVDAAVIAICTKPRHPQSVMDTPL